MTRPSGIPRMAAGPPRETDRAHEAETPRDAVSRRDALSPRGSVQSRDAIAPQDILAPCEAMAQRSVNGPEIDKALRSPMGKSGGEPTAVPGAPAPAGASGTGPAGAVKRVEKEKGKADASGSVPSKLAIYGALDLGTNNCRLLVARPSRRGFVVVDAFSRIIRLGEGVQASGRLSESAMRRTIAALRICADKMRRRGVTRSRLIATEACRIASNGPEFIKRVERETGLALNIVGRETEAKLAVSGCASLLDRECNWALVFDIGGGSSELIWLNLAQFGEGWQQEANMRAGIQEAIAAWTSLPLGVVSLAERHGGRDVTPQKYEAMVLDVMGHLSVFEAEHQLGARIAEGSAHFLGTSGTVTTICGIHLGLPRYDRGRVDGCWLQSRDVRAVSEDLVDMSYADRVAQPCIGRERADLVLAGCAILEALLRTWPCERLRVADRGLREGILTTLMAEDGHQRRASRSRRRRRRGRASTDGAVSGKDSAIGKGSSANNS